MVTDAETEELKAVFGVMGGFMQPQGHIQVLLNRLLFGMSSQAALDAPKICIPFNIDRGLNSGIQGAHERVSLEDVISASVS